MRETRSYGSVRGAAGNSRPYREPRPKAEVRRTVVDQDARHESAIRYDRLSGNVQIGASNASTSGDLYDCEAIRSACVLLSSS